jgi:predicted transposase YdaD
MADKRFDATLKDLIEDDHLGWATLLNPRPVRAASFVDADVSTVTAAADKVLRVQDDAGVRLLALEPLSSHDLDAPRRLHLYCTVLHHRHNLAVRGIVLLLRRHANATNLTGRYELCEPGESEPYDIFRYHVVRLWEHPLAPLLSGGLGLLPLAPLTDEAAADPGPVIKRIETRLRAEAPPGLGDKMRTATFLLMGLRYDAVLVEQLFEETKTMEDSTTYQLIISRGLERGRLQEARRILVLLGEPKFGAIDAATQQALEKIDSPERLEQSIQQVQRVSSWQELLATS